MSPIRVIFFGSGDIGLPTLDLLLKQPEFIVVAVVTQPDKPVGRKQLLQPTPLKTLALSKKITVLESLDNLPAADLGILVAYGNLLSKQILQHFPKGIINLHPSLLPRWRGAAPIQYSLLNDDKETGVSIMLLDTGMDTGPILSQQTITIETQDNAAILSSKLAKLGAELTVKTALAYCNNHITPKPQVNTNLSHSRQIKKIDGKITKLDSLAMIYKKYRAFYSWPGIYCIWNKLRLKIIELHFENNNLIIDKIQPAGKPVLLYKDFVQGYSKFNLADIE
ncbi:MAG: methionyl-tRNA formyltransferase [Patescibacteria group bacterium]|jgi:methionyl-tRNA formyltransferase